MWQVYANTHSIAKNIVYNSMCVCFLLSTEESCGEITINIMESKFTIFFHNSDMAVGKSAICPFPNSSTARALVLNCAMTSYSKMLFTAPTTLLKFASRVSFFSAYFLLFFPCSSKSLHPN